jgi:transposase
MPQRKIRLAVVVQQRLIEHFVAGTTARMAAVRVGVHRHTAAYFYRRRREQIVQENQRRAEALGGSVELDESYFGGHRKGQRGRGAAGKVPVFGILKRGGEVYAQMIPDARTVTLLPIIQAHVQPDSVVYTDSFLSYDALNVEGFRHQRINHSERFAEKANHINGIENFWNQAKRHLRRFNGIPKTTFNLYLQECVWRFNNPNPLHQIHFLTQALSLI